MTRKGEGALWLLRLWQIHHHPWESARGTKTPRPCWFCVLERGPSAALLSSSLECNDPGNLGALIRQRERQGRYIFPFSADDAGVFQTEWQKWTRAGDVHVDTVAPKKGNAIVKNSLRGAEHFLTCSFRGTVHSKWSSCPVTVAALQVHNFITPRPKGKKKRP